MFLSLTLLAVLVAVLLTLSILIQSPKGGGLNAQFGGAVASQLMGVKRTSDLVEKITWGAATVLMTLVVSTNLLLLSQTQGPQGIDSPNIQRTRQESLASEPPLTDDNRDLPPNDKIEDFELPQEGKGVEVEAKADDEPEEAEE